MAVDADAVRGFATGSAALPADDIAGWSAALARPAHDIRVTGGTDRSPQDVDAATGSPRSSPPTAPAQSRH